MTSRRCTLALTALLVAVVHGGLADRQTLARPEPSIDAAPQCDLQVELHVIGIRASHGAPFLDERLRPLADQLAFTRYETFVAFDPDSRDLVDGQSLRLQLGLHSLRAHVIEHDASVARVRVRLYDEGHEKVLDTTVRVHLDRTFLIAGPHLGDDQLILAVSAHG